MGACRAGTRLNHAGLGIGTMVGLGANGCAESTPMSASLLSSDTSRGASGAADGGRQLVGLEAGALDRAGGEAEGTGVMASIGLHQLE